MKLSKNFSLDEFLVSQTAERHDIEMTPGELIIENIQELVDTCLQPLRESLDAVIFISSGYRPLELNHLIGSSLTSAHLFGRAADFRAAGYSPLEVCERIRSLSLPYDQNIHEFGRWTHLGIDANPRKEDLTAYRRDGKTRYAWDLLPLSELTVVAA